MKSLTRSRGAKGGDNVLALAFWICLGCVLYTYALYPLGLWLVSWARPRPVVRGGTANLSVSIVVAAYNEVAHIGRRVRELAGQLARARASGEMVVVSDGSTDGTAGAAAQPTDYPVRVIQLLSNSGKAAALSEGCRVATGDVLVFADARQVWAPDALERLLENFADPAVGAVSGDLVLRASDGVTAGVGLYWRYEKAIRRMEGRLHSVVGVTGAISAVRRELFSPIPRGTILDDVYWPTRVVLVGKRVVHDPRSIAYDHLPERAGGELRRKVRTLSGNFQLMTRLPVLLVPGLNPLWLQFVSHKLLRLVVPWALLLLLISSGLLHGWFYRTALAGQLAAYVVGLVAITLRTAGRWRLASAAGSFLLLNAAAWLAFWVWITGRAGTAWTKVSYVPGTPPSRAKCA